MCIAATRTWTMRVVTTVRKKQRWHVPYVRHCRTRSSSICKKFDDTRMDMTFLGVNFGAAKSGRYLTCGHVWFV